MKKPIEKLGSPEDLVEVLEHHGVKGMRWGHRTASTAESVGRHISDTSKSAGQIVRKHKKGIAIGVGSAVVVVGSAFVAYKLHQKGKLSLHSATDLLTKNTGKHRVSQIIGGPKGKSRLSSKKVDYGKVNKQIKENLKLLEDNLNHPGISDEGKEEMRGLIEMLKSVNS